MSDPDRANWVGKVSYEPDLLQVDPLLVRFTGGGPRDLRIFFEDLVSWSAGTRQYSSAANEYIEARNFPSAARCALKIGLAGTRRRLSEQVLTAWFSWQDTIQSRCEEQVQLTERFLTSGCEPALVTVLAQAFAILNGRLDSVRISKKESPENTLEAIASFNERDIRAIIDDLEYLGLAQDDCDKDLSQKVDQHHHELASIRQQSAKLVSLVLSAGSLDSKSRERALQLALQITSSLDRNDTASAKQVVAQLNALAQGSPGPLPSFDIPSEAPIVVPRGTSIADRRWELSEWTKKELAALSTSEAPAEFPEDLEDPPGWEWDRTKLDKARIVAQAHVSARDGRYRDRSLGPFLVARGKQALLDKNPEQSLVFFREAYAWSVHASTSLRAPARWRKDCAWGILLSIIFAFNRGNDPRLANLDELLSSANLEALFSREIGALPLAAVEDMRLFPDVAHHILAMDAQSGQHFIREQLSEYLIGRPIALQEFGEGLTMELPEKPSKIIAALVVLLDLSDDVGNKELSGRLLPFVERAERVGNDERELRYILDDIRNVLRPAAAQSDFTESLIEGLEARSRGSTLLGEPRLTVRTVSDQGSLKRLALRISYTSSGEVLRGVEIQCRLETQQSKAIEGAIQPKLVLGRLTPGETREIGIPLTPKAELEQAAFAVLNVGRRDDDGVLQNVDVNGNRLRFPGIKSLPKKVHRHNPYVVGRAINDVRQILGRDREINDIVRRLIGQSQDNVVLVLGERRIGKTTVLTGLEFNSEIRARYLVVRTDVESAGGFVDTSGFYKLYLIEPILRGLQRSRISVDEVSHEVFALSPHRAFETFMAKVDEVLKKQGKRLLVILDELEKVFEEIERRTEGSAVGLPEEVVAALRAVMQSSAQISFVLAGITDVVRRHLLTPKARLFNLALLLELTPLPRSAASELISGVVKDNYSVTPRAESVIIDETNCHPYLLQKVCHELFQYITDSAEPVATEPDVASVLDTKIVPDSQSFVHFVETIRRRPEDMALVDALAFIQLGFKFVSVSDLQRQLIRSGQNYSLTEIKDHLDDLLDQAPSLLERAGNNPRRYRIKVPLFARHRRLRQLTQHNLLLASRPGRG